MAAQERLAALATWMAGAISALFALSLPLGYGALTYQSQVAALETETALFARAVTDVVHKNPELWRFQVHTLEGILQRRLPGAPAESRRIIDAAGVVAAQAPAELPRPLLTRSWPVLDAGTEVGRLVIERSLQPLLLGVAAAAAFGLLLGAGAFTALQVFPMRALRRALQSLFAEKERAQVTLRSIADGVVTTDGEHRLVLMNEVAERLTGWTEAESLGLPLEEIYRVAPDEGDPLAPQRGDAPLRLTARDGSERVVSESRAFIRDEEGLVAGVVVVVRDVTEQRRLEQELVRAQKLESVGLLAGGIAHDFNNVLTAILGNIAMAKLRAGPVEGVTDRLSAAEKAVQRAASLTRQLLTFSQGGAPLKEAVRLPEFLPDAVGFALTGSRVRCRFVFPSDLWPVEVDAGQMSQVVNNLVINADQAMPRGGGLTVSAYNLTVTGRDPLPLPRGRYVKISFADQGVGIPAENLKRIFDPFFTTKKDGTGLGLASVYSILKRHGGHVEVQSEPGAGTTFDLYLAASEQEPGPPAPPQRPAPAGRGRVLLMDDEAPIREVTREILEMLGYECEAVADGEAAVALYRDERQAGRPFGAVMTDLTVPGGMGGEETLKHLLALDPQARVIVVSGYHTDPILADFRRHGFCGALAKPFQVQELAAVLSRVLGGET